MKDKKKKIDQNLKHLSGSSSDVMCEVDMAPQWHQTFLGGECVCVCVCVCVWVCGCVCTYWPIFWGGDSRTAAEGTWT